MITDKTPPEDAGSEYWRGYHAARQYFNGLQMEPGQQRAPEKTMAALNEAGEVGDQFRRGWIAWCDSVAEMEAHCAEDRARRPARAGRAVSTALTYAALAGVMVLACVVDWSCRQRKRDIQIEEKREAELAGRVRWLGSVQTSRRYYLQDDHPGRPTGGLTINNPEIEIGLRGDGTMVWRKAGPTPGLTQAAQPASP